MDVDERVAYVWGENYVCSERSGAELFSMGVLLQCKGRLVGYWTAWLSCILDFVWVSLLFR